MTSQPNVEVELELDTELDGEARVAEAALPPADLDGDRDFEPVTCTRG